MKERFGGIDLEMAEGTIIPRVETVRLTLVIDETAEESLNMVKMHVLILYLTLKLNVEQVQDCYIGDHRTALLPPEYL